MRTWIFQTTARNRIETMHQGHVDQWCVRRYWREMQPDDLVFVWLAGSLDRRGIHGWGRLTSQAYRVPDAESLQIGVRYEQRLMPLLPATVLRDHPCLADLAILRMPRATNFRVSIQEVQTIMQIIERA